MKKTSNLNVNGKAVANQFLIIDTEDINFLEFQSYDSKIATYHRTNNTLTLFDDWDYSKTTLKYLKHFINDYTCFKYESKAQFLKLINDNENITLA